MKIDILSPIFSLVFIVANVALALLALAYDWKLAMLAIFGWVASFFLLCIDIRHEPAAPQQFKYDWEIIDEQRANEGKSQQVLNKNEDKK